MTYCVDGIEGGGPSSGREAESGLLPCGEEKRNDIDSQVELKRHLDNLGQTYAHEQSETSMNTVKTAERYVTQLPSARHGHKDNLTIPPTSRKELVLRRERSR